MDVDDKLEQHVEALLRATITLNKAIVDNQRDRSAPLPEGYVREDINSNGCIIIGKPATIDKMAQMTLAGVTRALVDLAHTTRMTGAPDSLTIKILQEFINTVQTTFEQFNCIVTAAAREARAGQAGGMFQ